MMAPGRDNVLVVDIGTDPLAPKIIANLPLMNTIFEPPTNLQIAPDGKLGLVANSMNWVADGATWKAVPDNKHYVIDLIDTVTVGRQPSGMSINRAGDLALIANRADNCGRAARSPRSRSSRPVARRRALRGGHLQSRTYFTKISKM